MKAIKARDDSPASATLVREALRVNYPIFTHTKNNNNNDMTRHGEVQIEPTGVLTHDHLMVNKVDQESSQEQQQTTSTTTKCPLTANSQNTPPPTTALSTIAIMRRHPMYDCLVLVKRYRPCLDGYILEFPTSIATTSTNNSQQHECCKIKLVSVYLDGDDPIYQCQERQSKNGLGTAGDGEIVYVPMNGLLDRLDNYDHCGVSIDGKVYAFAMGIRSAEKFLITTNTIKEIQETPPI